MLSGGQALAANWTLVQTVLMWVLSRNSDPGSETAALEMLAKAPCGKSTVALSAGLPVRLVEPFSLSESFGAKPSWSQPSTWKALDGVALAPLDPATRRGRPPALRSWSD